MTLLNPSGPAGKEKERRRRIMEMWGIIKDPASFAALTATERWELVRRFMVFGFKRWFKPELMDEGDS